MKRATLILATLVSLPVLAKASWTQNPYPADYRTECGSCHVPFPPALLDKADWNKIMQGLDKHFGTDASLDDKATGSIGSWLQRQAGTRGRVGTSPPRITGTIWFKREHREVPSVIWKDPRIKTSANCAACHRGAEQGRFSERELSIPGLGRRHEDD